MCNAVAEDIGSSKIEENNCLTEIVPNIVMYEGDVQDVTDLELIDKPIKDITGVEYFRNLDGLALISNQIADLTPLENLTNLTELFLVDNRITDITPLSNLTNLTHLYLGKNQISDLSPLSKLINLKVISLNVNPLNNITPLLSLDKLEVSMESFPFSENISSVITNSENYDLPSLFLLLNDTLDVEGELAPWVVAVQGIIRYTKEAGMIEYRYQNAKLSEDGKSITIEDINEPAIVGVHLEHPEAGHILLAQLTVTYEEPVDPDDPVSPTDPTNDPAVPNTGENTQESSTAILTATLCILSGIVLTAIPMARLYRKTNSK